MKCRLCAWLCDRLCPPDASSDAIWRAAKLWEDRYGTQWEPAEGGDTLRERWDEADKLFDENPAASLAIHIELAEGGSAHSMLIAGDRYWVGQGTQRDIARAEGYYRRALGAGSWKATIRYAVLLFEQGAHDKWPSTLQDGVHNGFIPSFFWLAWYRYKLSPCRQTAREVRPLLETAAEAGHPGAAVVLARWMAQGKLGLREVPRGFRMMLAIVRSHAESANRDKGESEAAVAALNESPREAA